MNNLLTQTQVYFNRFTIISNYESNTFKMN